MAFAWTQKVLLSCVVSLKSLHVASHGIATVEAELCPSYTPSTTGAPMYAEHLE